MADGKSDPPSQRAFRQLRKTLPRYYFAITFPFEKTTRLFQSKIDTAIFYAVNDEAIENRCADQSQASV